MKGNPGKATASVIEIQRKGRFYEISVDDEEVISVCLETAKFLFSNRILIDLTSDKVGAVRLKA